MFKLYSKKAFTLIELLIVIAIIGILSSITLISLKDIKIKARDTRIMVALNQSKPFAEMIHNDNDTYNTLCTSPDINTTNGPYKDKLIIINDEITNNGGEAKCYADGDNYCVYSKLNILGIDPMQYFCVDNTGNAITTTTDPGVSHCKSGSYICL